MTENERRLMFEIANVLVCLVEDVRAFNHYNVASGAADASSAAITDDLWRRRKNRLRDALVEAGGGDYLPVAREYSGDRHQSKPARAADMRTPYEIAVAGEEP